MRKIIERLIKSLLAIGGLRLARLERCVEPVMPFGLLEVAIRSVLFQRENGFYFVQLGASDGIRNDFLRPLIRKYCLSGCLVEPDAAMFARLIDNYADQTQLEFRNVRITEHGAGAESFATFCASLPARIDMLYVDANGADDKLVKAALEAGARPSIIHYEWTELPPERRCDLKTLLLDHGYRFIDVGADTVSIRVEVGRYG